MRITLLVTLLISIAFPLSAERAFMINSPRSQAMGNCKIAIANSSETPFFNPAGFASPDSIFTIVRFSSTMNADAVDLFTSKGSDILEESKKTDIAQVSAKLLSDLSAFNAVYEITGPLFVGYKGENFGLGIYNTAKGKLSFSGNVVPTANLLLDFDIGIVAGLGLPIKFDKNNSIQMGFNLKYINRIRYEENNVSFFDAGKIVDFLSPDVDFLMGQAIGSDIGLLVKLGDTTIGVVIYDWFGMTFTWKKYSSDFKKKSDTIHDSRVSPRISTGIAYAPGTIKGVDSEIISGLTLAIDIQDFIAEKDSFFKMLHMGGEVTFLHTLTMRMGFNQGYFTFGLGVTLFESTTIEYTLFQEELGTKPGQEGVTYHTLGITIKI